MKKFNILGVHWKIQLLGKEEGVSSGKTDIQAGLPKKGGLDSLQI